MIDPARRPPRPGLAPEPIAFLCACGAKLAPDPSKGRSVKECLAAHGWAKWETSVVCKECLIPARTP